MLKFFTKSALFCCIALLAGLTSIAPAHAEQNPGTALFEVSIAKSRFTIKLKGRAVQQARRIIRQKARMLVIGQVVVGAASYNRKWSFHLDPKSIQFGELAIEVCDSTPEIIQKNLDSVGEDFLPGNTWCPWNSSLVKEIKR